MPSNPFSLHASRTVATELLADIAGEIQAHARRRLPDLRGVSLPQLCAEAGFVFAEIYASSSDSEWAVAEAIAWLDAHPRIRGPGPEAFVESWAFYNQPDDWRPKPRRAP